MKKIKLSIIFMTILMTAFLLTGCNLFEDDDDDYEGVDNIDLAVIWNGLSSIYPDSGTNNAIAEVVREKTKVNMRFNFYDGFENDNLTRIFAVGKNMPDVIMAPYWGGGDPCSATIRQAVEDGLLIPVDQYLDSVAPNLKNSWNVGVSENFVNLELSDEAFDGKKYIIPMQTPASVEDINNWGYTVYGRKDIISDLNVDPASINTSDDVYELAKKIKDGNYKDINGNNIIVSSTFAYGWSYETYINSFRSRSNLTNIIKKADGTYDWICNTDDLENEIRFMYKMINEGLFDKTSFAHGQDSVIRKHITGGVALTSTIYSTLKNTLKNTLYVDHPEMEYIPLGPIVDANGVAAMPDSYREEGEYGFPVLLVTKDCDNPEAVMRYLNYVNSEEGKLLTHLGIEGEDYERNSEGKIVRTAKFLEEEAKNPNYEVERGISYHYIGVSQVPNKLISDVKNADDETYWKVMEMYPVNIIKGTYASAWDDEFKDIEYFRNVLSAMNYQTTIESAYCASSLNEALDILNRYRENLDKKGYLTGYLNWLATKLEGKENLIF